MALADLLFEGVELLVEGAVEFVGERTVFGGRDDASRDDSESESLGDD